MRLLPCYVILEVLQHFTLSLELIEVLRKLEGVLFLRNFTIKELQIVIKYLQQFREERKLRNILK